MNFLYLLPHLIVTNCSFKLMAKSHNNQTSCKHSMDLTTFAEIFRFKNGVVQEHCHHNNYHSLFEPRGIVLDPDIEDRMPKPPRPLERKFPPEPM